jgi:hypothetical protein
MVCRYEFNVCIHRSQVSADSMLAPMASNNLPVGIRDERPTFFMLEFANSSFLNASYLSLS